MNSISTVLNSITQTNTCMSEYVKDQCYQLPEKHIYYIFIRFQETNGRKLTRGWKLFDEDS